MRVFLEYIIYFFIYSFLGWVCESVYCSIYDKKVTNRGFLNGPICPIYGTGSVLVIMLLDGFKGNIAVIFILGAIVTSFVEYITSYLLEVVCNARWWDYSSKKYNINGRVCLLNSFLFGVLCVLLIEVIHSGISGVVDKLSYLTIIISVSILTSILLADFIVTITSVVKLNSKLKSLDGVMGDMESLSINPDEMHSQDITGAFARYRTKELEGIYKYKLKDIKDKLEKIKSKSLLQKRLFHAFPDIKHTKYHNQLTYYKKLLKDKK
ncbi:MAG: putative ABC transporter permease [Clostridium sp.]